MKEIAYDVHTNHAATAFDNELDLGYSDALGYWEVA